MTALYQQLLQGVFEGVQVVTFPPLPHSCLPQAPQAPANLSQLLQEASPPPPEGTAPSRACDLLSSLIS